MSALLLAERVKAMSLRYEEIYINRGGITPTDPLRFHLYHLARYWCRLIGFCRQCPANLVDCVDSDLGACIQVGSEFTHNLIQTNSPVYMVWQDYWKQTQAILHQRPVTIEAIDTASHTFNACLAGLNYDPWAQTQS